MVDASPQQQETIAIQRTLAAAVLKAKLTAAFRLFLIMWSLDPNGSGHLRKADVRKFLVENGIMTDRYFRMLLNRSRRGKNGKYGKDIFWTERKSHATGEDLIALRSIEKIAVALGITHLYYRSAEIPTKHFLGGVKDAAMGLFAAYISGVKKVSPKSHETLERETGLSRRTQQRYVKELDIRVETNIKDTGREWNDYNKLAQKAQDREEGRGDSNQGYRPHIPLKNNDGMTTIGVQIANTYLPLYEHAPMGRQKKRNKRISALVTGTSRQKSPDVVHLYHPTSKHAEAAFRRNPKQPVYWPANPRKQLYIDAREKTKLTGATIWEVQEPLFLC